MDKWLEFIRELPAVLWAGFGGVGGAVGYLLRSDDIKIRDLTIEAAGAGFVGALVSMAAQYYVLGTPETGVLVGVSSLVGARATLRFLQNAVLNRLKLPQQGAGDSDGTSR